MNAQQANSGTTNSGQQKSGRAFLIAVVLIAIVAISFLALRNNRNQDYDGLGNHASNSGNAGPNSATGSGNELLDLNRVALAATENLEPEQAETAWEQLFQQNQSDASIARNRSINRILIVDELAKTANDSSLEKTKRLAARSKFTDAADAARAAIEAFAKSTTGKSLPLWMRTRIDLHEASLLPKSMTKSKRTAAVNRLADAIEGPIGKEPKSSYLGGSIISVLEQMEDPIDGLPEKILDRAMPAIAALSDAHPDNLFFALRSARLHLDNEDPSAARFVKRASGLTTAIQPSVAAETRKLGLTPVELVGSITEAIDKNDFAEADGAMQSWFNVLNGSEILKTDRRRALPHPLDLLSFDSLRRASADAAKESAIDQADSSATFEIAKLHEVGSVESLYAFDFDLDLDDDVIFSTQDGITLLENDSSGGFSLSSNLKSADVISGKIAGMTFADLFVVDSSSPQRLKSSNAAGSDGTASNRHNTLMTVVAYGDWGARLIAVDARDETEQGKRLTWIETKTGLEEVKEVTAVVAGDLEADGDLDLVIGTKTDGVRIFVNRGNRTFFELENPLAEFATQDFVTSISIADLDRDLDLDLVTTHESGKVGMIENLLHLQFRGRTFDEIDPIDGANTITVEDIDGNVSWDLVIGGKDSAAVVFSQTADSGAWTIDRVETQTVAASKMQVADLDNDSWLELVAANQTCKLGPWGIAQPTDHGDGGIIHSIASDFTGDGAIDLVQTSMSVIELATNTTQPIGHYLKVRFKGIDDNVSGRVNHFAIGSVLEVRFGPHYRARIVRSPLTHFGMDGVENASGMRAILPNGLTQTTRDPDTDSLLEEEQTLKGSCPYLYAWDGEKFAFVTDCLWAAPLGLQVASGVVAKDRPWEYLKIDGSTIKPIDDHYEFRITEELWEVAYFDKVAITAVDHPAGVDVWTNEKVGPAEIATPTVFEFESSTTLKPTSAASTNGDEATDLLTRRDREFVKGFDRRLRQGLCPPHWIDLTFDSEQVDRHQTGNDAKTYLVLTGWILPTDTSLNIQIDQNPSLPAIEFPSVWVRDSETPRSTLPDGWKKAIPFVGFPGGKTKTIVIDVSELAADGHHQFRVRTSAQIYWDAAELAFASQESQSESQPMELISAEVGVHGFSRRIKSGDHQPETYDYQNFSQASRWPPLRGKLTQLGDCTDLVRHWDDEMVVISSGDEIRLKFAKPKHDPPEGWVRDFIVHSVGWDKDADLNTLAGQTIGPLPSREMKAYPPSSADVRKQQNLVDLNAKHRSREQAFRRFWFREGSAPPMWSAK